ncbi:MAG TPA: FAD-dependent oxidoreductase [Candidatus Polarisedimenticolia bacterium]|nr:FAD-dependent oxidoreductase [Candidatus Polarisedimenticolia bacterium]
MKTYDVIVLGGGTAGTAAAEAAHHAGARVAMFNDGELGGLCILRGCMPTKTLLHAAHLAHQAGHSDTAGVRPRGVEIDFAAVMANKDAKVARFKRAKVAGIEAAGYEVIDARARFSGPDTVEAGHESYSFSGAVLATGSEPSIPLIPGLDTVPYLTSDDLMRMTERPASILAIGSGAVGLELCQFLARMGTRVTLVCRRRVCDKFDPVLGDEMQAILQAEPNFELIQPDCPVAVRQPAGKIEFELQGGRRIAADALMVATGRRARLDGLGLAEAGVEVNDGRVVCGDDMRTSNRRIFVAGDATGREMILHVASMEGRVAGLNAAAGKPVERVDRRLALQVVFTDPPLAVLGLTEPQARRKGREIVTALIRFPETGRAITMDVQHGLCKLVADVRTGEILGAQILGPRADDLIHTIAVLMSGRGTAADMLSLPWYHPTLSEVFLSLAREIEEERGALPGRG